MQVKHIFTGESQQVLLILGVAGCSPTLVEG